MSEEKGVITVRCDKELQETFVTVAKGMDSDASKELRKFMREYVAKHGQMTIFKTSEKGQKK